MIGRLRGELIEKRPPQLLLDVHGVGYEVEAPMSTFYTLPECGEQVVLHTHLVVREDAQLLYGFASESERTLFRALIRVTGIGARIALALLSAFGPDDVVRHIQEEDSAALTRAPGVGRKIAERLVVELRDRLSEWGSEPTAVASVTSNSAHQGNRLEPPATSASEDAVSALIALGYRPADASRMVQRVEEEGLASEELIRRALQAAVR